MVELPPLLGNESQCKRCYSNRECMLYAAAGAGTSTSDDQIRNGGGKSPSSLLTSFTGHLSTKELDYFRHWDRLLDLESDAENSSIAKAWLLGSHDSAAAIGSLVYDTTFSDALPLDTTNDRKLVHVRLCFPDGHRSDTATLTPGQRVVVSSDSTTLDIAAWSSCTDRPPPRMHLARAGVVDTTADGIVVRVGRDDQDRILRFLAHTPAVRFRLDHDKGVAGMGTLRQNLIQLLTADKKANREPGTQAQEWQHLSRLRRLIIEMEPPLFLAGMQLGGGGMSPQLSEEFKSLNPDQKKAVMQVGEAQYSLLVPALSTFGLSQVLKAKDYALIQGLPGTGACFVVCQVVLSVSLISLVSRRRKNKYHHISGEAFGEPRKTSSGDVVHTFCGG